MYILVQKGKNDPYYVPGQRRAGLMKEYPIFDNYADLEMLMTGGMKPEYYTRKRNFDFYHFWPSYKWLKTTHTVCTPSYEAVHVCWAGDLIRAVL